MLYFEVTYNPSYFLLRTKKSPCTKIKVPKKIAKLFKKYFKRTNLSLNWQSWILKDFYGTGRWHLEKENKDFTLHYDEFDPERGPEYALAHLLYDVLFKKLIR
ncbi:hypothetical protein DRN69_06625 [Candidatus Pacearchaeota archaeon]|nr:MAG: hypothetical protein DRN69_06625 [Candidatus Pacearchaeota archaeon]